MVIIDYDNLNTFSGRSGPPTIRTTQHVVPLLLQFQKFIDVSTSISIQSPVRLLVAVIEQQVDPITKNAVIEFATNLIYPYTISGSSLTSDPGSPMHYLLTEINDGSSASLCPNSTGSTCTQRFQISVTTNGACQITGTYGIQFALSCQVGPNECPLPAGSTAEVTAAIISENFCTQVSALVSVSGSLLSYSSNTYTTTRALFLVDQVSYFMAQVSSSQATLTNATIASVSVVNSQNSNEVYLLYADGLVNSLYAGSCKFSLDTFGSDFAAFFFTANASIFNNATNTDVTKTYSVKAQVNVQYAGVPGTKRIVLQGSLGNRQITASSTVQFSSNNLQGQPTSSSSSAAISTAFLGIVVAIIMTFLGNLFL